MGTGTTSSDSCRVGSNNYGELLRQWLSSDASITYERHSCSGDTISGLNSQIGKWGNMGTATVGTLTIGGNDVEFSDLVYYCVITPNTAHLPSTNRQYCLDAEKKANDYMDDSSTNGLRAKLKNAYISILQKSGRNDFDLFVTGYPKFFDEQTTKCNKASFHYWWSTKEIGFLHDPRIVLLTTDLRTELDALVTKLNGVIQGAIQDANNERDTYQVHFVDVVDRFSNGNHRWCEDGVADPEPSRQETWFFLSAWPDVNYDTTAAENSEVQALVSQGQIRLPDSSTCYEDLSSITTGADPYQLAMCRVAQEVADDPSGPQALRLNQANRAIAAGDVSSQDIPWYIATRQAKTFHPRSPGMAAYRDAIIEVMQIVGSV
ncbi:esterase family protein [Cadophora sp. DSE1049]|nr:esterase family protein [Cadophora sp. DSE1049]